MRVVADPRITFGVVSPLVSTTVIHITPVVTMTQTEDVTNFLRLRLRKSLNIEYDV
jgi:hypothetical protein